MDDRVDSDVVVRVRELALSPDEALQPDAPLRRQVAKRVGWAPEGLPPLTIVRRALDARRHRPQLVFTVEVSLEPHVAGKLVEAGVVERVTPQPRPRWRMRRPPEGPRPLVVGAGPAGLFAALTLTDAGWPPILIERGKPVEARSRDVSRLYASGQLNPDSNVCYGEGGAGTYSDGKLYTRVGDRRVHAFMERLVQLGADPDILVNSRPHLGTDRLVTLMQAIRAHLAARGATLRFETALESFDVSGGAVGAVRLRDGERLAADRVILATGHSARPVWHALQAAGAQLEARPFAVGFRVEHPQELINAIQYGKLAGHAALPAADYRLTHKDPERGVYSFCMCPGGVVVTTPTEAGGLCINGMSHASRAGRYANSALVVSVGREDFARAGHAGLFAGVDFQRAAEQAAYRAGGGAFVAPACRLTDFLAGRTSPDLGSSSYRRGLWPADLGSLYPAAVIDALRRALRRFDGKMRGFVSRDAQLIGVETRTASPIRVRRDAESLQVEGIGGLYPVGEGMGYGGGIASAAVDGIRAAEAMLQAAGATCEETVGGP